jgi:hypothetical protein
MEASNERYRMARPERSEKVYGCYRTSGNSVNSSRREGRRSRRRHIGWSRSGAPRKRSRCRSAESVCSPGQRAELPVANTEAYFPWTIRDGVPLRAPSHASMDLEILLRRVPQGTATAQWKLLFRLQSRHGFRSPFRNAFCNQDGGSWIVFPRIDTMVS